MDEWCIILEHVLCFWGYARYLFCLLQTTGLLSRFVHTKGLLVVSCGIMDFICLRNDLLPDRTDVLRAMFCELEQVIQN